MYGTIKDESRGSDENLASSLSGSDLNTHNQSSGSRKNYDETDPLLDKDEKEEDDGKICGISKTLVPFYGVYKLITKAGPYPLVVLLFLLFAYLHNQLVRYTLSITAKEVAQDLHYGDESCMMNTDALDNVTRFFPKYYKVYEKGLADWTDMCDNDTLE